MSLVVVIAEGAKEWQERLEAAGWPGELLAVEVSRSINELADVAIDVVRALGPSGPTDIAAVVGVGAGGRAAQLLALGGRAEALVLVDGLTHRFASPSEVIGARMEWMLRRVDGDFPPIPRIESRAFTERAASAVPVPTLVVEGSSSGSSDEVVEAVLSSLAKGELVRIGDGEDAAKRVVSWLHP